MDKINNLLHKIDSSLYRCSAKAICIENKRILMVTEKEGWLGLPGGGIEYGETIEAALRREIVEELAVAEDHITIGNVLLVTSGAVIEGLPRLLICYRVDLHSTNFGLENQLEWHWLDKNEFANANLGPSTTQISDQISRLL